MWVVVMLTLREFNILLVPPLMVGPWQLRILSMILLSDGSDIEELTESSLSSSQTISEFSQSQSILCSGQDVQNASVVRETVVTPFCPCCGRCGFHGSFFGLSRTEI